MPILLGDRDAIERTARAMNISLDEIEIEDPATLRAARRVCALHVGEAPAQRA